MIHRIALLLGGLAAVGILAFGIIRGDRPVSGAPAEDVGGPAPTDAPARTGPREVLDTVYIAAPRAPKVIHVTRRTGSSRPTDPAPERKARRHRDDDEHEGREHKDRQERGDREHDDHERGDD